MILCAIFDAEQFWEYNNFQKKNAQFSSLLFFFEKLALKIPSFEKWQFWKSATFLKVNHFQINHIFVSNNIFKCSLFLMILYAIFDHK